MHNLIPIHMHDGNQVISARDLHEFLEVQSRFNDWIKNRITKYDFLEGHDYTSFTKNLVTGGKQQEYALNLDMAKELSMVENNDKGRQARRYFIACERQIREQGSFNPSQLSRLDIAKMLVIAEEEKVRFQRQAELQTKELQLSAPKVQYYQEVLQSQATIITSVIAKEFGVGAPTFNRWLKDRKVIYSKGGTYLLYHRYQNKGYTKTKTHKFTDGGGIAKTGIQLVWTEKGRAFLHELLADKK